MSIDPTDYMAAWEAMMSAHSSGQNSALDAIWENIGTCAMRDLTMQIAEAAAARFHEEQPDVPFDWEYLPAFVAKIRCFDPLELPAGRMAIMDRPCTQHRDDGRSTCIDCNAAMPVSA